MTVKGDAMPDPITRKIAESHQRTAAHVAAAAPPVPSEPAPEVALPGPTMRDLMASATATDEAQARAQRDVFFSETRRIAVQGIPRWEAYGAEARALLARADAEGIDRRELERVGMWAYLERYDIALRDVRGVLEAPQIARDALSEIDHMTLAEMTVSHLEQRAGLVNPQRWYILREKLHCVGAGTDRIEPKLRGLPELLERIRNVYRGKLVEQGALPATQAQQP